MKFTSIGAISRKILADVQLDRAVFGKDPGTEAPGQVALASKQNSLPGKAVRFQETGTIAGDGAPERAIQKVVDRSR